MLGEGRPGVNYDHRWWQCDMGLVGELPTFEGLSEKRATLNMEEPGEPLTA